MVSWQSDKMMKNTASVEFFSKFKSEILKKSDFIKLTEEKLKTEEEKKKDKEDFQLKIVVSGENLATVRSTVDDLLACLGAIESTLNSLQ